MKDINAYCSLHSSPEWDVLQELARQTHLRVLNPRMLSGHTQGLLLQMLVSMICPTMVLEIGTYTGYSALCIARNLGPGALLHTVEIDDEIALFARTFIEASNLSDKIIQHVGDAAKIIPTLDVEFQLAFIDGDKRNYIQHFEIVMERMLPGGFIVADNVLWDGHVLDETIKPKDQQTKGIIDFNKHVKHDQRVEKVMLPLRDGLTIMRKI